MNGNDAPRGGDRKLPRLGSYDAETLEAAAREVGRTLAAAELERKQLQAQLEELERWEHGDDD
jgi:hypothetical protein